MNDVRFDRMWELKGAMIDRQLTQSEFQELVELEAWWREADDTVYYDEDENYDDDFHL